MAGELTETAIGDVCQVFDGPHATPTRLNSGPIFLGITSLKMGRIDLSTSDHVSEEDFVKWTRRVTPRPGDVVFSYETKLGDAAIIPEGLRCCLGRRMGLMRPDPMKLDSRFLLYYYLGPEFQDVIRERTIRGSTVDRIALLEFPKFPLRIPPLPEQKAIAAILGALDDKIELNRRMNATLESMARALFDEWFVATDRGWAMRPIGEMVEGIYDGPHATPPESDNGPIFLGIKNLTGSGLDFSDVRHISEEHWEQWTRRVTPKHQDIVFSYEATLGFFAIIPDGVRCCLGRRLALVRPKREKGYPHFWFHQFVAAPFQQFLIQHSILGATVNRIPLINFPKYPVLDPPDEWKSKFEAFAAPLWEKIHSNQSESRTLAALRDSLLPKLLRGEVRVVP